MANGTRKVLPRGLDFRRKLMHDFILYGALALIVLMQLRLLAGIRSLKIAIFLSEVLIMAAIDDLNAAETTLETVVGALITDIQTLSTELSAAQASNNDAAVEAVATKLTA